MSQMVHVVSMLEVMMSFGDRVFQSSEVSGAVCSGVLELERSAKGCNFCVPGSRVLTEADLLMELVTWDGWLEGKDQSLRWSPDVASRSVDCLEVDGGSQEMRVTGYAQVASATLTKSKP